MSSREYSGIETALYAGMIVNASAGSGHLRVVEIVDPKIHGDAGVRVHDEHVCLDWALDSASVAFASRIRNPECKLAFGSGKGLNSVDDWVFHGHKLRAQRTNGTVTIEARSWDNRPIVYACGDSFAAAYSSLTELICPEALEKAEQL